MSSGTGIDRIYPGGGLAAAGRACYSREGRDETGSPAGSTAKPRIMIVEDDYFAGLASEQALLAAGYDVVGLVTNGHDAVALAERERPALVVMDIQLAGGSDGVAAAIEISEHQGIRSIFATAQADKTTQTRAAAACPLGWLAKPFSGPMLVRAVASALRMLDGDVVAH